MWFAGPLSWDDDEDSSPFVQDLDLGDHDPCSNYDMTTFGYDNDALTHDKFLMATHVVGTDSKGLVTTGSNRKVATSHTHLSHQQTSTNFTI